MFKAAEQTARASGTGLWAGGVCDGQGTTPDKTTTILGGKWYVSSYHTSKYYVLLLRRERRMEIALSEKYLEVYDSEAALLADFPYHTLHESCQ